MYLSGSDEGQNLVDALKKRSAPYLSTGLEYAGRVLEEGGEGVRAMQARLADKDGDLEAAIEQGFQDAKAIKSQQDLWNILKLLAGIYVLKKIFL